MKKICYKNIIKIYAITCFTCPIELLISECGNELLLVSPGAGGKELCKEWCLRTEEAVLLSSSSSSSDAEPIKESIKKSFILPQYLPKNVCHMFVAYNINHKKVIYVPENVDIYTTMLIRH